MNLTTYWVSRLDKQSLLMKNKRLFNSGSLRVARKADAVPRQCVRVEKTLAADWNDLGELYSSLGTRTRTFRQSNTLSISKYRRILCDKSSEERRHHCQGRGRFVALGKTNIRGRQRHQTSFPRQLIRLLSNRGKLCSPLLFSQKRGQEARSYNLV